MGQKIIVGLSGLAGSGKSTASQIISNAYGVPRRPFAFPLKRMIGALGIPAAELDGPASVKELPSVRLGGHTLRYAMQTLGTEWGRQCMGETFWVDQWMIGIGDLPGAVADDCRFPNEVEAIQRLGGIIIRIERAGAGVKGDGAKHASEQIDKLPFDYSYVNCGTRDDMDTALRYLIDRHFGFPPAQLDLPRAGSFE